jgi:putative Mg2+ transporter-C (MgtC) family protein
MWEAIWQGIQADFSDIPALTVLTQIVIRILLAAVLGGCLGWQRERLGKAAGLSTHMLVSMGAAFFVLVPLHGGVPMAEISRVLQGIITGIGFLGAGTILQQKKQAKITGLTTAAGLWFTAAIGIAAGMGLEVTALLGTLMAFVILAFLPILEPSEETSDAAPVNSHKAPDSTP